MIGRYLFQHLKCVIMVICITTLLAACDEDEPWPTPETPSSGGSETTSSSGTVSFGIENSLGSGVGTTTSPAVVETGDTLAMEIRQKSSYTDTKTNQVFTCEPKAEIQLYAITDTIYADNIEALTKVNTPQTSTSVSNGECDTYHINQTFEIGTQEVDINLSYQAYTFTNSNGDTIEMPYIKLNQAQSGKASSKQSRASDEADVVVSTVTLRPIGNTRTVPVTETHEFEVTATFNVTLEAVNTQSENEQTLNFEVKYIAFVDQVTEYPDPTNSLAYKFELNNSTVRGTTFSLNKVSGFYINQTSTYTAYNHKSTVSPKAWVKLTAMTDTLEVMSVDEITQTTGAESVEFTMSGEKPKVYSLSKQFTIGKQNLEFELGYESYSGITLFEEPFEMPYYKLSDITQESVTYEFLENANYHDYYKVTAVYNVEMESVNTDQDKQTLTFEVNYIAFIDMVLEGITYDKEVKWEEGHDNFVLGFRPYVYRHRKFNNGMVVTDTIAEYNYSVVHMSGISIYPYEGWSKAPWYSRSPVAYRNAISDNNNYDNGTFVKMSAIGVVGLSLDNIVALPINFAYKTTFDGRASDIYNNEFDESTAVNGRWYMYDVAVQGYSVIADTSGKYDPYYLCEEEYGLPYSLVTEYGMHLQFICPFLWIDNQKITFDEDYNVGGEVSLIDIQSSRYKKAKLCKYDGVIRAYNRDIHFVIRDTIYEYEGVVPEEYQQFIK